jgi:uncharacterized protein (DUF1800 family)
MALPYPETVDPALRDAAIAATRFGYGARPGELRLIATDPRGWLLSQLQAPTIPARFDALPHSAPLIAGFMSTRQAGAEARRAYRRETVAGVSREALVHTAHAIETDAPFLERLIRFLGNHFTISIRDPKGAPLAFAHEREAIRPHAVGMLSRLMTETVRHPAMILYHDNELSIGPFSEAGLNGARGLSVKLARAVLERHALGPGAEVSRGDVNALAKMFTGWSIAAPNEPNPGTFVFRPQWHEPNAKMMLNRRYPDAGVLEAEAAMESLSRQERAVRNLATKMARHFVDDEPPGELIGDMLDGFVRDGNTIAGMARGMIESSASWRAGRFKVKTPEDLVLSTARALGLGADQAAPVLRSMRILGQPPKAPPSSEGWPDRAAAWLAPQQLLERVEWSAAMANRAARRGMSDIAASDLGLSVLGPRLRQATHRRLVVTADRTQALALLLAAPEFQGR